nr:nucleocapsid [Alphacoronavirus sp.]
MSVNFAGTTTQPRGRVPLSLFQPLRNNSTQPLHKLLPSNAVPNGASRDHQIGYWNEQIRWRMVKGQRKDLPSNWHFYYLGTGPHADLSFRTRTPGVFWVAKEGAVTRPTGLGTRGRNSEPKRPVFDFSLPGALEIVDNASRPNSRANSRNRSQSGNPQSRANSQNRNRSQSRGRQQNNQQQNQQRNSGGRKSNQNRGQRGQSRGRSQSRGRNSNGQTQQDLVAAVREALAGLGITANTSNKTPCAPGKNTPKRSKSPAPKSAPEQMGKPVWKRTPHSQENVTRCFGERDAAHNFGDAQLTRLGVDYAHYPQIAQLIPSQAAILFGSEVTAREVGDDIEITYVYKMNVPKKDPSLVRFLPHISAFSDNVEDVTMPDVSLGFVADTTPLPQRLPRSTSMQTLAAPEDEVEIVDDVIDDETSA